MRTDVWIIFEIIHMHQHMGPSNQLAVLRLQLWIILEFEQKTPLATTSIRCRRQSLFQKLSWKRKRSPALSWGLVSLNHHYFYWSEYCTVNRAHTEDFNNWPVNWSSFAPSLHPEPLIWSTRRPEAPERRVHCNNGGTTTLETIGEMYFLSKCAMKN